MFVQSAIMMTSDVPVGLNVTEMVAQGALYLDEKYPGWRTKITRKIDISGWNSCIFGQVIGGPPDPANYFANYDLYVKCGFITRVGLVDLRVELNREWERVIHVA